MPSQALTYALWLVPPILQGLLALAMLRRNLAREFPVFYGYTVMHVVRACLLFGVYRAYGYSSYPYFRAYWIAEAVDTLFQLAVTYEIYSHVFRRYDALAHLGGTLFRWSLVALLFIAIASATTVSGSESDVLRAGVLSLHQSTLVISGGLLLLLFIFAASFGLTWRQYVFGIAAGLCLCTSVEMAAIVVLSRWGAVASSISSLIHTVAYNCSVLVWVGYFFRRETAPEIQRPVPRAELERWNEALAELLNR